MGIISKLQNEYKLITYTVDLNRVNWLTDNDNKVGKIIRAL